MNENVSDTKTVDVLAVLDWAAEQVIARAACASDANRFATAEALRNSRAAIAKLIETSRKVQEHVAPLLVQNGDGYLDVMEAHRAALRAVGGAE